MDIVRGGGFGSTWPVLVGGGRTLAPAMPVAVGTQRESGNDGEYRRGDAAIWREAVGSEELFLNIGDGQPPPGQPFELLWFGESERFIVRGGLLEVSDLFGELRVPAQPALLEKLVVRGKRIGSDIVASLRWSDHGQPQTIEVRRPALLSPNVSSLDPAAFMTARADVSRVRAMADHILIQTADGAESSFRLREHASGWELTLESGGYVFTRIHLQRGGTTLKLRASLADDFNAMAPGMRGRLVFDLRSDLVALG
jgi:hypothetical protein